MNLSNVISIFVSLVIIFILPLVCIYHLNKTEIVIVQKNETEINSDNFYQDKIESNISAIDPESLQVYQSPTSIKPVYINKSKIIYKAKFSISGKVLKITKHGSYSQVLSGEDIMPVDIGIMWGKYAVKNLEHVSFRHSKPLFAYGSKNLWLYWNYPSNFKDINTLKNSIANIHIVPVNENILRQIKKIDEDDYVKMEGYLVDIETNDKIYKTSLSRSDDGAGACEILYVDFVNKI